MCAVHSLQFPPTLDKVVKIRIPNETALLLVVFDNWIEDCKLDSRALLYHTQANEWRHNFIICGPQIGWCRSQEWHCLGGGVSGSPVDSVPTASTMISLDITQPSFNEFSWPNTRCTSESPEITSWPHLLHFFGSPHFGPFSGYLPLLFAAATSTTHSGSLII